jgi:DNA-nicking Smr family endonuclease
MKQPPADAATEEQLFQQSVEDVKPLPQHHVQPYRATPRAQLYAKQGGASVERDDLFSDGEEPVGSDEQLLFYRAGLQRTTLKKLRKGQIAIEAELDLHGYTVAEARVELTKFVHFSLGSGLRCVSIIHGRGKSGSGAPPILKQKVNHWLRQRDEVLAFCSAINRDGGTGAIYLLLRRA